MTKDVAIRTTRSLGTTPEYVLQPHTISRSIYNLSATARKLTAMAMSMLPADLKITTVQFTLTEFLKAVGLEKGGNSYKIFTEAVDECMGTTITISTPKGWEKFTWFSYSKYDNDSGLITMAFSDHLAGYILELKRVYARIELSNLGKLSSKYALRIYEFAISYSSMAGKNGNAPDCWYFERTVEDLRQLLAVDASKYKLTKDFRIRVIEDPIKEINAAHIGIEITTTPIRQGKYLYAIRFNCKNIHRRTAVVQQKNNENLELEDKEFEKLAKLYPEEYQKYVDEYLQKPRKIDFGEKHTAQMAHYAACSKLREAHGVRK